MYKGAVFRAIVGIALSCALLAADLSPLSSGAEDVFGLSVAQESGFTLEVISSENADARPPRIYIYHTHTFEAYAQDANAPYKETEKWRSADADSNMLCIGRALADSLSSAGMDVYHDAADYETPLLSTAYARSLEALKKTMNAPYDLYLDLHRDSYSQGNGENAVTLHGKKLARILFLVGQGTGFTGDGEKPNWQKNAGIAEKLTLILNQECDNLCRGVSLKNGRYNQQLAAPCLLVEIGNNQNTKQEALNAVIPLSQAICAYFDTAHD